MDTCFVVIGFVESWSNYSNYRIFDIRNGRVGFESTHMIDPHEMLNMTVENQGYTKNYSSSWGNPSDMPIYNSNFVLAKNNVAIVVAKTKDGYLVCDCWSNKPFLLSEKELLISVMSIKYFNASIKDGKVVLPDDLPSVDYSIKIGNFNREPTELDKHTNKLINLCDKAELLGMDNDSIVSTVKAYLDENTNSGYEKLKIVEAMDKYLNALLFISTDTIENAYRSDYEVGNYKNLPFDFDVNLCPIGTNTRQNIRTDPKTFPDRIIEVRKLGTKDFSLYDLPTSLPNLRALHLDDKLRSEILNTYYTMEYPRLETFEFPSRVTTLQSRFLPTLSSYVMDKIPRMYGAVNGSLWRIDYSGKAIIFDDDFCRMTRYAVGLNAPNAEILYLGKQLCGVPCFESMLKAPKLKYIIVMCPYLKSLSLLKYCINNNIELYIPEDSAMLKLLAIEVDYNNYSIVNLYTAENFDKINELLRENQGDYDINFKAITPAPLLLPTVEEYKTLGVVGLETQKPLKIGVLKTGIIGYDSFEYSHLHALNEKLKKVVGRGCPGLSIGGVTAARHISDKDIGIILSHLIDSGYMFDSAIEASYKKILALYNRVVRKLAESKSKDKEAERYLGYFRVFTIYSPYFQGLQCSCINATAVKYRCGCVSATSKSFFMSGFLPVAKLYLEALNFFKMRIDLNNFGIDGIETLLNRYVLFCASYLKTTDNFMYKKHIQDYEQKADKYVLQEISAFVQSLEEFNILFKPEAAYNRKSGGFEYSNVSLSTVVYNLTYIAASMAYNNLKPKENMCCVINAFDIFDENKYELFMRQLGYTNNVLEYGHTSNAVVSKSGKLHYIKNYMGDIKSPLKNFMNAIISIERNEKIDCTARLAISSLLTSLLTVEEAQMINDVMHSRRYDFMFEDCIAYERTQDVTVFLGTLGKITGAHVIDLSNGITGIKYYEKENSVYKTFRELCPDAYNAVSKIVKEVNMPCDVDNLFEYLYLSVIDVESFIKKVVK